MDSRPLWAFMRERHQIYLRRKEGSPPPWTSDRILQKFAFTNVYRELDKTTVWFRENVRDRAPSPEDALFCTVAFRWFNRIETGRKLLEELGPDAWFLDDWHSERAEAVLRPLPQWVTGAYMIKSPTGMDKLTGILRCIDRFFTTEKDLRDLARTMINERSLERAWEKLIQVDLLGPFLAYEIVTDLRHTAVLRDAKDINTWANAGPGAMRGLNRLYGRDLKYRARKHPWIEEMCRLHDQSKREWPKAWPALELREIEHSLCEFDKYERVRLGQGRPRSKFHGGKE